MSLAERETAFDRRLIQAAAAYRTKWVYPYVLDYDAILLMAASGRDLSDPETLDWSDNYTAEDLKALVDEGYRSVVCSLPGEVGGKALWSNQRITVLKELGFAKTWEELDESTRQRYREDALAVLVATH